MQYNTDKREIIHFDMKNRKVNWSTNHNSKMFIVPVHHHVCAYCMTINLTWLDNRLGYIDVQMDLDDLIHQSLKANISTLTSFSPVY